MSDATAPTSSTQDGHPLDADFRDRRLRQVLLVLLLLVGGTALVKLAGVPERPVPWVLIVATASLCASLLLLHLGARQAAAATMLTVVTATLVGQMALHEGLRDEAILGMPGVLLVAALLGSRRQMLVLLFGMVGAVALLGWANHEGWHLNRLTPPGLGSVVDISAILLVTGFLVALLADDLSKAMERLRFENDEVRRSRSQVEYLATHDALTGLPNRVMVRDRFDRSAAAAKRSGAKVALLYLDMDHFKTVNDTLGHAAGDQLLLTIAQRLLQALRESDIVCRLGGDIRGLVPPLVEDRLQRTFAAARDPLNAPRHV
jgi:GGDEF domain-containing protein